MDNSDKESATPLLITLFIIILIVIIFTVMIKILINYLKTQHTIDRSYIINSRRISEPRTIITQFSTPSYLSSLTTSLSSQRFNNSSSIQLSSTPSTTILRPEELPQVQPVYYLEENEDKEIDNYYNQGNDYNSQFLSMYYQNLNTFSSPKSSQDHTISYSIDPFTPHRPSYSRSSSSLTKTCHRAITSMSISPSTSEFIN
ncbi:hypothetical protein EDI_058630 [Entamoeba dispar SAW760]|uniref:Uncharacterized protein n=1 Tax=Entamoeba dispar (strain ATCC PRA-260 / SAW760) TaxID=370354 RepID=B0E5C1_ENTDS|nr:uncharacterized protein EDI_058630 [Entamoeba dispar SAW760]EDR30271.1 hypothetical protein EDI_058630 [Entamoeba dispar SAW760]|eukprot:EDR30271.1 hypothetical protein EDI_058630 [Entamoeba dispar SAW760]